MKGQRPNTPKDFWAKVDKSGGPRACWLWTYYISPRGYGMAGYDGRTIRAHRLAYQLKYGWLSSDVHVLHRCDNPACCNPAHLFVGDQNINNVDMTKKGRQYKKLPFEKVQAIKRLYQPPIFRDWGYVKQSRRRWTQQALAEKFGVSRPLISLILNDKIRTYGN